MGIADRHRTKLELDDRKQKEAEKLEELREIRRALEICFSTPEGLRVLKWLKSETGFEEISVAVNMKEGGEILPLATVYNEGRRSVFVGIKNLLTEEILRKV